jgi:hypothetical protein
MQSMTNLYTILTDMSHANCNTTLSERINRGVTISIMDSNNSVWSGEDVCVAMGALRYCHVEPDEGGDTVMFSDMIYEDSDDNDTLDIFSTDEEEAFTLNPFAYDLVSILAECLHNMQLNTRRNNSDGKDLSVDDNSEKSSGIYGDATGDAAGEATRIDDSLQRVIAVPHLARAAFGMRHLSADNEAVQRALEAIVDRLQDNYIHHFFPSTDDSEDARMLLLSRMSVDTLDKCLKEQVTSLTAVNNAPSSSPSSASSASATPSCSADDLCLLLSAVGKKTLRYTAVGKIYQEVAKLLHDPQMVLLLSTSNSALTYHPAVGQLSLEDISKVFYMLRFNQCSSEVRLVVAALSSQLLHLNAQDATTCVAKGSDVSSIMKGMTSMSSSVVEVRTVLKHLHDHLQQQQQQQQQLADGAASTSGGAVSMSPGDISSCLGSMSNMNTSSLEVQDMLRYFCARLEEVPHDSMRFSVDELYSSLEGLSGMSIGGEVMKERELVHRLIDLIRSRSS